MADLLPCPFCGGEATVYSPTCTASAPYDPSDRAFPEVQCLRCYASAKGENWDHACETAAAAWNTRTAPAVMHEDAPRAVIGEIGNQIHNLGCSIHDNDDLQNALEALASRLWDAAQTVSAEPAPAGDALLESLRVLGERLCKSSTYDEHRILQEALAAYAEARP